MFVGESQSELLPFTKCFFDRDSCFLLQNVCSRYRDDSFYKIFVEERDREMLPFTKCLLKRVSCCLLQSVYGILVLIIHVRIVENSIFWHTNKSSAKLNFLIKLFTSIQDLSSEAIECHICMFGIIENHCNPERFDNAEK